MATVSSMNAVAAPARLGSQIEGAPARAPSIIQVDGRPNGARQISIGNVVAQCRAALQSDQIRTAATRAIDALETVESFVAPITSVFFMYKHAVTFIAGAVAGYWAANRRFTLAISPTVDSAQANGSAAGQGPANNAGAGAGAGAPAAAGMPAGAAAAVQGVAQQIIPNAGPAAAQNQNPPAAQSGEWDFVTTINRVMQGASPRSMIATPRNRAICVLTHLVTAPFSGTLASLNAGFMTGTAVRSLVHDSMRFDAAAGLPPPHLAVLPGSVRVAAAAASIV